MNLIYAYQLIHSIERFRKLDTTQYNFNVMRRKGLYFVFLEPIDNSHPKWNRVQAFVTEFPEDLSDIMNIYEFANSKGAVEYEFIF